MTTLECMYLSVTENSVSVDIIYLVKKKKDDLDIIWIQIDPREILRMMGFAPCPGPCPLPALPPANNVYFPTRKTQKQFKNCHQNSRR